MRLEFGSQNTAAIPAHLSRYRPRASARIALRVMPAYLGRTCLAFANPPPAETKFAPHQHRPGATPARTRTHKLLNTATDALSCLRRKISLRGELTMKFSVKSPAGLLFLLRGLVWEPDYAQVLFNGVFENGAQVVTMRLRKVDAVQAPHSGHRGNIMRSSSAKGPRIRDIAAI